MDASFNTNTVSATGLANIRHIATLRDTIEAAFARTDCIEIDLDASGPIDLSFLQLVESARLFARQSKKNISLSPNAREAVRDTLKRAGFLEDISEEDARFWLHEGTSQ